MAAKEQWKKLGIYIGGTSLVLGLLGSMIGIVWAGSGKFTAYDKDIGANALKADTDIKAVHKEVNSEIGIVANNQAEDRLAIKEIASIVAKLKDKENEHYQELKDADNAGEVRSEKISSQFTLILSHMAQQTETTKRTDSAIGGIRVDIGKLQTQYKTLTKD
jgi:hypothetical protein